MQRFPTIFHHVCDEEKQEKILFVVGLNFNKKMFISNSIGSYGQYYVGTFIIHQILNWLLNYLKILNVHWELTIIIAIHIILLMDHIKVIKYFIILCIWYDAPIYFLNQS